MVGFWEVKVVSVVIIINGYRYICGGCICFVDSY